MRLWGSLGLWGGGLDMFCLSLMTVAFLQHPSHLCVLCLGLATTAVAGESDSVLHQPTGRKQVYFRQVLVRLCRPLLHCPTERVLTEREEPIYPEQSRDFQSSTFHSVERTNRWFWKHYFCKQMFLPCFFLKGEFDTRRVAPKQRLRLSPGTDGGRHEVFCVHV